MRGLIVFFKVNKDEILVLFWYILEGEIYKFKYENIEVDLLCVGC